MDPRAIWVLRSGTYFPHRKYNWDSRVSSQQLLATEERHGNLGPDIRLVQIPIWDLQNAKRSVVSQCECISNASP